MIVRTLLPGAVTIALLLTLASSCRTDPAAVVVAAPAAVVAPVPIEKVLPLVGDVAAKDAFGYPVAFVDRVALQQMLRDRRFAELTAALEAAQDRFEGDWHYEYWPHDSVEAFTADPAFEPMFNDWVKQSPNSFAPWAARGWWLCELGLEARGEKLARDTPDASFREMESFHERGVVDLQRALQLRPRAVSVARALIVMGTRSSSVVDTAAVMQSALESCPTCLHLRVAYLVGLLPRWGGSYDEMDAFAAAAMTAGNPRLAVLGGYSAWDRAEYATNPVEKRRLLDVAISHGGASDFYRDRAAVRSQQHDDGGAVADLRKVVELRPAVGLNHGALAVGLARLRDWREAEKEMRLAIALESFGPNYRSSLVNVLRGQVEHPDAPRELLDVAIAFESDPQRLGDLQKRRDGWTSYVVPVDEPPSWATQLPEPSTWASLLDSDDALARNAAWCRILDRAARAAPANQWMRFRGVRCEVLSIERATNASGATLRLVFARDDDNRNAAFRPFLLVNADGAIIQLQPHAVAIGPDGGPVAFGADGARKAIVSSSLGYAGRDHRTLVLQVQIVDDAARAPLRVALGPPQPAPRITNLDAAEALRLSIVANAALLWRQRAAKKPADPLAFELVTRDAKPRVVATFAFDEKTSTWRGPEGSQKLGFGLVSGADPRASQLLLDAWNRAFNPCATSTPDPTCPAQP